LLASSATDGPKRTHVAAIFITTGCCATVEIINHCRFAAHDSDLREAGGLTTT